MRPLARRREMMARPPRVLMRARKPSLRARGRFLGCQVRFIVFYSSIRLFPTSFAGRRRFDLFSNLASTKRARSITRQKSFANPLNFLALQLKIKRPVCAASVLLTVHFLARYLRQPPSHFLLTQLKLTGLHLSIHTDSLLVVTHCSRAKRLAVSARTFSLELSTGRENPMDNSDKNAI